MKHLALFCACATMLLVSACNHAEKDAFIFTYAQEQPLGSLRGESMEFFERELEQRTNGRIQVELYC
ncbi:MAG: hypothetical protein ACR2NU_14930, partial [Aeoliella sp.]